MDYTNIYKKVEIHVTELFEKHKNEALVYHNFQHTKLVVSRTKEIAAHYELVESDMMIVYVAAWFHDAGYLLSEPRLHEEKSVELMKDFMHQFSVEDEILNTISECIMATRYVAEPVNLLQQIIRDADTFHFGTKDFKKINKQVYEEFALRKAAKSKLEWNRDTIAMLNRHKYYTAYCNELLTEKKMSNIKKLKKSVEKAETSKETTKNTPAVIKEQNNFTTKGIQTMLRLTSENHMKLSDMADGKANILISVNSIIISVIITVLLRRLQENPYLTIPTAIFLVFTLGTIIISILATRPKVTEGTFSDQDIIDKKTNLLFFGNFHKTSLENYEKAMQKMMNEPDYLYGSLVKDIYQQGVVLARKFKLIRLAYNIFMVGIIISVFAFALAVYFGIPPEGVITNPSISPL
jgi:predicted metal-dependent HD superfamily phosphohydrolase